MQAGMTIMSALPFALTDPQLDTIFRLATPLKEDDRAPFLKDVIGALAKLDEIGDGAVTQVCVIVQRRYWSPPHMDRGVGIGKHGRRG